MMNDPKLIDPQEPRIPDEWRQRYQARSLGDLTKDVNELFAWKRTSGPEKDRVQREILRLQKRYDWALGLACVSFVALVSLLVFEIWRG
ncbi:MAG: hypothetical protein ABSG07_20960 [Terriglobales bacterium]